MVVLRQKADTHETSVEFVLNQNGSRNRKALYDFVKQESVGFKARMVSVCFKSRPGTVVTKH